MQEIRIRQFGKAPILLPKRLITSSRRILYHNEKGTLYKENDGYYWEDNDGKVYSEDSGDIKIKSIDTSNLYTITPGFFLPKEVTSSIYDVKILEIGPINIMGCLNIDTWDEVDCIEIKDTGIIYAGKHNASISLFVSKDGTCESITSIMSRVVIAGVKDKKNIGEYIPEGLKHMTWKVGRANWQGKPISKNQKIKIKMLECCDSDQLRDFDAIRLELIDKALEVYWDGYTNIGDKYTIHVNPKWCDKEHKFYEV